MASVSQLTQSAIKEILEDKMIESPVLQVLGTKKISAERGTDRHRLLLSDGIFSHSSAMLATQLNGMVDSNELSQFAVIRLNKYLCNKIQGDRKVLIILDVEVVTPGPKVGQKLGEPQPYKAGAVPAVKPQMESKPSTPAAKRPLNQSASGTPSRIHPIESLNPYQNRWTIRARVTKKYPVRTWSNSRGDGKVFSIDVVDTSGEIKATMFNDLIDKFYDLLEVGKVYNISKGTLKTANKQFNSLNNDYEITFNADTTIEPCDDDDTSIPNVSFNFIEINKMADKNPDSIVDVIGVVKTTDETKTITTRNNKEMMKRDLQLVDQSKAMVRLTLWGDEAANFDGSQCPILAVRGCRLSAWNGRSLSALSSSIVQINPDIPEAHQLRGWYDSTGCQENFDEYQGGGNSMGGGTTWRTIVQIKNVDLDKPVYSNSKATIVFLKKENCMYQACPTADCNKKVIDQSNGSFRCEKCNKEYDSFKYRLILSMNIVDHTDNTWVTCFQDTAEQILGKTSEELGDLRKAEDPHFDLVFSEALYKSYNFKLRSKMETYNDESRIKTTCTTVDPVDLKEYNTRLLEDIEKLIAA